MHRPARHARPPGRGTGTFVFALVWGLGCSGLLLVAYLAGFGGTPAAGIRAGASPGRGGSAAAASSPARTPARPQFQDREPHSHGRVSPRDAQGRNTTAGAGHPARYRRRTARERPVRAASHSQRGARSETEPPAASRGGRPAVP
jgi:hypothetical protein